MLLALLLMVQAPANAPLQQLSAADVRAVAERGDDAALRTSVEGAPVASRDAVQRLLERSATSDSAAARRYLATAARVAEAIAVEHGDSFPLRQVARFSSWTVSQRRLKVAVDSLRRAGNAAMSKSSFQVALRPWRESLRRARAMNDTAGAAAVLGNIGTGFYGGGSLDSAVAYYREAARLAQSVGDQRTALNALGGMANVQRDRGDTRAARQSYEQSMALRAEIGDVRGIAADRTNLGMLYETAGDAAEARASYLDALDLATRYAMPEAEAAAQVNLGQLASLEANYAEALARYGKALGIYRALGYRPDEALVLRSLGLLDLRRGNYRAARFRLEEAAVVYRETGPTEAIAQVQEDLARASMAMGNPQSAIEALDRAAATLAGDAGGAAAQARLSLASGDLAVELNDHAAAERWYTRSEMLARQAGDLVTRAGAQQGRGYLLLIDGSEARAIVVLNQAARAMEQAGDRRAAALIRLDVAAAYAEMGEMDRARALTGAARDTLRRLGDPAGEAAALGTLASLALDGGRPAVAESLYRAGLDLLTPKPAPGVSWSLRSGLAQAEVAQGQFAQAAQDLRAAVRDVERSAAFLPSPHARSAFLTDKWTVYEALAQLELTRGRDTTAFEVSEQVRSRQFLDELARGPVAWNAGADTALIRREQDLRRAITELSGQLEDAPSAVALVRGPDPALPTPSLTREALARTRPSMPSCSRCCASASRHTPVRCLREPRHGGR